MSIEKFRNYDLNLLLMLHVLLDERGVTAAADRLGLTQGAVSRALGRLRDQLDDELLVRVGKTMVPTPRAERMAEPLEEVLHRLGLLFEPEQEVDPADLDVQFCVATTPDLARAWFPAVAKRLHSEAPRARLVLQNVSSNSSHRLAVGETDVVVAGSFPTTSGLVTTTIAELSFVVLARTQHPRVRGAMSLSQLLEEQHVAVAELAGEPDPVDAALQLAGHRRSVAVRVPSHSLTANLISQSDLISIVPTSVAAPKGVQSYPPPIELPKREIRVAWHERVRRDPGHRWFRKVLAEVVRATLSRCNGA